VVLLALSAILSATLTKIKNYGTEIPLSYGPFHTCSCALVQLLLTGNPDDSPSAYGVSGEKREVGLPSRVGMLSGMEIEQKFLVRDELKFPRNEVYVLHGRDHFTLCFQVPPPDNSQIAASPQSIHLMHWNGLPPGGPRMTHLLVIAPDGCRGLAPERAEQGVGVEYKPVVNSIDSVIQARPLDKLSRPKQWKTWSYEVALVIDDPSNQSPPRPIDMPLPPLFSLREEDAVGQQWRCRACYETRYTTMCFGLNDASNNSECCVHCGGNRHEVQWTLWLPYEELPNSWKRYVDRQHGPPIVTVLRTKWPNCNVEVLDPTGLHADSSEEFPSV
jgi:hypothetical protein